MGIGDVAHRDGLDPLACFRGREERDVLGPPTPRPCLHIRVAGEALGRRRGVEHSRGGARSAEQLVGHVAWVQLESGCLAAPRHLLGRSVQPPAARCQYVGDGAGAQAGTHEGHLVRGASAHRGTARGCTHAGQ
eukprot:scaffold97132_cov65-Phaeocystis_antarctica.AAC.1